VIKEEGRGREGQQWKTMGWQSGNTVARSMKTRIQPARDSLTFRVVLFNQFENRLLSTDTLPRLIMSSLILKSKQKPSMYPW